MPPTKKSLGPDMALLVNFTKHLKKNQYQSYSNSSKNRRGTFPNTFYYPDTKASKDIIRKENYRQMSLMNTYGKILNKIMASPI